MPGMIRLAALHARQPHLGGAEEQRVDLVEIAVVPLEDVVERRAIVLRCRRGNLGNQLGELGVIGPNRIARLAAVQDAVVGAADRPEIVFGDRRERRRADPAHDLVHVESEGVHLVQARFEDPRGDLHAAREARRRCHDEREVRRREPRLLPDPAGDFVGGQRARLEHEHAALRPFRVAEFRKELLFDPGVRAQRPRSHREVFSYLDRPAGVLGGHAAHRRMVGPHPDAGPRLPANRNRRVCDVREPARADLGHCAPGAETARGVDTSVDDSRAPGKLPPRRPAPGPASPNTTTVPAIMPMPIPLPPSPVTTSIPRRIRAPASSPTFPRTMISPPDMPRAAPGGAPPALSPALPRTSIRPPDIASPKSRPTLPSIVSSPPAIPVPIPSISGTSPSIRTTLERPPRTLKNSPSVPGRPPCTTCNAAIAFASSPANRSAAMQSATST